MEAARLLLLAAMVAGVPRTSVEGEMLSLIGSWWLLAVVLKLIREPLAVLVVVRRGVQVLTGPLQELRRAVLVAVR